MKASKSYKGVKWLTINPDRVMIYQRKKQKNEIWYVRILKEAGGYVVRSLKTKRQAEAEINAEKIYLELLMAERDNVEYGKSGFKEVSKEFISSLKCSVPRRRRVVHAFERYFNEFFGGMEIRTINNDVWSSYIKWRMEYWDRKKVEGVEIPSNAKRPSKNTVLSERQILLQMLNWSYDKKYLVHVPRLIVDIDNVSGVSKIDGSKKSGNAMTRTRLSQVDYRLREDLKSKDTHKNRQYARHCLYYMTKVIYHSLIRPINKEIGAIKWKDIEIKPSRNIDGGYTAIISLSEGKRKGKPMLYMTNFTGTVYLLRWRKYCIEYGLGNDDDWVFANYDGGRGVLWHVGTTLRRRLIKYDLRENEDGSNITLYSFRATAITQRIRDGHDVGQIAKSANTSLMSISKSYHVEFMRQDVDRFADNWIKGQEAIRNIAINRDRKEVESLIKKNWKRKR